MNRNQRILVALSNSEQDAALIDYARLLCRSGLGREIRFVHVLPPRRGAAAAVQVMPPEHDVAVHVAREVETRFGAPPQGGSVACHLLEGERVDALLEFATRSRSDVILLGHRQQRSGQRSLARRLAMIAPSSVWMVPEGAPVSIRRVLAPVDFSQHSADSLEVATAVARATVAERCLALHVYYDASSLRYAEHLREERAAEVSALYDFLSGVTTHEVDVEPRLEESSSPSRTIMRVAQEQGVDLIVMSTRGRSRAAAVLLGSVTTQVMVETPVAVLAVKHFGAAMGLFQALKDSHFWQPPLKTN